MDVTVGEICKLVAVQLGRRKVAADARLVEDLGAESLDLVNVVARIEERFGVAIDETELAELRTVSDLYERVCAGVGGSAGEA